MAVADKRAGQRVKASITTYLDRQLKLPVNEHKSQLAKIEQCEYLGFTVEGASCAGRPLLDAVRHAVWVPL